MKFFIFALMAVFLLLPVNALADMPQKYCRDHGFKQVVWKEDSGNIKVIKASYLANGTPVLTVHPRVLSSWQADPLVEKYAFYYECARLALGHLIKPTADRYEAYEQVKIAECWAINKFYYDTSYEVGVVTELQEKINNMPREQWMRFPGPVRVVDFTIGSPEGTCRMKDRDLAKP